MEKFVFLIFHTCHDTNVCKLIFHDVDDFEYAPRITETTYLSLAMLVDTKTSCQLLICNMFLEGCSEGLEKWEFEARFATPQSTLGVATHAKMIR